MALTFLEKVEQMERLKRRGYSKIAPTKESAIKVATTKTPIQRVIGQAKAKQEDKPQENPFQPLMDLWKFTPAGFMTTEGWKYTPAGATYHIYTEGGMPGVPDVPGVTPPGAPDVIPLPPVVPGLPGFPDILGGVKDIGKWVLILGGLVGGVYILGKLIGRRGK